MIWLGERLIDLGMWFRREPTALPFTIFYGTGITFLIASLIVSFLYS